MLMIMAEEKMLELTIVLTVVTAAAMILPAGSLELSLATSGDATDFSAPIGESLNITCQGVGDDKEKLSSLKWIDKDGNVIPEGIPGTQAGENDSLVLIFSDPTVEESGNYTCSAMFNENSLEKTVPIIFYSNDSKPDFQSSYENVTTKEGYCQEMFCLADGEPPITYEWFNQFQNIISKDPNSSIFATKSGEGSVLVIPEVRQSHEGLYTCSASNQHGLSTKLYELTVLPSCGNDTTNGTSRIEGVTTVSITATTVKFAFNVSGPVRVIKVLYSEIRSSDQYLKEWKYGDNYELKNLTSGGLYNFRFGTAPSEDDVLSSPYEVILLPDVPEVIFQTLQGGTVKLQWFRSVDDIMRGTIDRHELTYFTVGMQSGNEWVPNECNITVQIPKCAGSSYTVAGLSQNTYYQIQLRAHTASGYGEPYRNKIYLTE